MRGCFCRYLRTRVYEQEGGQERVMRTARAPKRCHYVSAPSNSKFPNPAEVRKLRKGSLLGQCLARSTTSTYERRTNCEPKRVYLDSDFNCKRHRSKGVTELQTMVSLRRLCEAWELARTCPVKLAFKYVVRTNCGRVPGRKKYQSRRSHHQ
jgi:hypothetical protein